LGVAYNKAILGSLAAADRLRDWPVEVRAALIGALVGLIGWFGPELVGGGDSITQTTLAGAQPWKWVLAVLVLRFALGAISYAARTPGGLFAPMLVLGAESGMLFGILCRHWAPDTVHDPKALAVVGMAAVFTGVVRAPLTGIILVTEMTGTFTLLLPMLAACFAAMLVPTLLGDAPIYDALRAGTIKTQETERHAAEERVAEERVDEQA
jgi:CIC family chloride channel protein